jgi:hypothetical protein
MDIDQRSSISDETLASARLLVRLFGGSWSLPALQCEVIARPRLPNQRGMQTNGIENLS